MFRLRIFVREALYPDASLPEQQQEFPVPPLGLIAECDDYTDFQGIARWNDIGSWSLTIPADSPQARLFVPGRGIVVFREGSPDPMFSGPIRRIEKSWEAEDRGVESVVEVRGVDDNFLLSERLAWPNPLEDIHWASKNIHWPLNPDWANIGELLRQVLIENTAGQEDRWVSKFYIPRDEIDLQDDESSRSTLLRFNQMDTEIKRMSSVYGFRVNCLWHPNPDLIADAPDGGPGPGILVHIDPVEDLTEVVQFGPHLGNLKSYKYSVEAPKATRAVIGGQHRKWTEYEIKPTYNESHQVNGYTEVAVQKEGPERYYAYHKNREFDPEWWGDEEETPEEFAYTLQWAQRGLTATEVEWGVSAERFIDQSSTDWQWIQDPKMPAGYAMDPPFWSKQARQFQTAAEKFDVENGPISTIELEPTETPESKHIFEDYYLGDMVRAHVDDEIRDEIVREVQISASADGGHTAKPIVGTDGSTATPYLYRQVKALWNEVLDLHTVENLVPEDEEVPVPAFGFSRVVESEV